MLAPGEIGERALVAAMDALGLRAAERARGRDLAGVQNDRDRGLSGLKAPGFKPDRHRIRQQA